MGQNPREELVYVRRQRLRGGAMGSGRRHHWRRIPGHGIVKYQRWPRYRLLLDRREGGGVASRGRGRRDRRPRAPAHESQAEGFVLPDRVLPLPLGRTLHRLPRSAQRSVLEAKLIYLAHRLEEFHIFSARPWKHRDDGAHTSHGHHMKTHMLTLCHPKKTGTW
ncbi:hypothetical protein E2C01_065328 [Portunus trituberculatus]|uniref:Uncharacterized protein n=1 Tax=Portunus trituberculatus TaxID=210409 RepID=A0A5B7HFB3_PORTR|nr:hypothetical protein [Portunus trituberculatus]